MASKRRQPNADEYRTLTDPPATHIAHAPIAVALLNPNGRTPARHARDRSTNPAHTNLGGRA